MQAKEMAEPLFAAPAETVAFDGVLFDMDGTLVDSTDAIIKHWHKIGKELGIDPEVVLETSHGRRSIDTFREIDPSRANWEYVSYVEGLIPSEFGASAVAIPGAREMLQAMDKAIAPWAIVTSGTRPLMMGWLDVLHLAHPQHVITAEDVKEGKPDPEGYLQGKDRIGMKSASRVLVVEDSPAGIRAGKAAGCDVLGLVTTYRAEQVRAAGADWIVKDLRSVRLLSHYGSPKVVVHISDGLVIH